MTHRGYDYHLRHESSSSKMSHKTAIYLNVYSEPYRIKIEIDLYEKIRNHKSYKENMK